MRTAQCAKIIRAGAAELFGGKFVWAVLRSVTDQVSALQCLEASYFGGFK